MTSEQLLKTLLDEPELPYLDRWFANLARQHRWDLATQKHLWDQLREILSRATGLPATEGQAVSGGWQAYRRVFRNNIHQLMAPPKTDDPSSCGIPRWLRAEWDARCRLSWEAPELQATFLKAQHTAAPRYLRFSANAEGLALRQQWQHNRLVAPGTGGDDVYSGGGTELTAAMKKGLAEVQDASSQRCLSGLELRAGQKVWDVCAGNGGKTLLLAEELRNKGVLISSDIAASKLALLKQRVKRHGWQNVRTLEWTGESLPEFGREIQANGGFDRVVVDAPCSASGTWRRDPEARYRLDAAGLAQLRVHQQRLLSLGWASLKPGGRLAYITCSWLPSEDEHIVDEFRGSNPCRVVSQRLWGLPEDDANTLFAAILEKTPVLS